MPKADPVSTFLKPLELVRSSVKTKLAPERLSQLKSIARQIQDQTGQVVMFTNTSASEISLAAYYLGKLLDLPVYRVDLSSVVSKYIGETEKNLSQIFTKAGMSDLVLLFDEADGLFGKRTDVKDAHDRFANMDTNYLLERIETYPGLVILTSNQRGNLDDAILRRARWVIDFSKPNVKKR
jgi:SpoVK/Ycf46/Vps4 family AAA+-type ATPase